MKNFTNEQMNQIMKQATEIMERMSEGVTAREIMAELYVNSLEDKTLRQGYVMADAILESVQDFADLYADAQDNLEGCIDQFQDSVEEKLTLAERCNYWRDFCLAMDAVRAAMDEEEILEPQLFDEEKMEAISEEEATPELAGTLREKAKELLKHSGFVVSGIEELEKTLEDVATAEDAVNFLLSIGAKEVDYRGILTMLAYTKIKNGEFEEIPIDMTIEQVAAMVCANAEQIRILEAVEEGSLAEDIAVFLLEVLGIVVLIKLAIAASVIGVSLITGLFGAVLVFPACMMFVAGMLHFFAKAERIWSEDSKIIVKKVIVVLRSVKAGAEHVATYAKEYLKKHVPVRAHVHHEIYESV